jgi:DNA-directed RNA polymerase specialized sigma24 family protein
MTPVKHREVLLLHFLQALSILEIAKVVGCSEEYGVSAATVMLLGWTDQLKTAASRKQ